jgi:hypothetical protein
MGTKGAPSVRGRPFDWLKQKAVGVGTVYLDAVKNGNTKSIYANYADMLENIVPRSFVDDILGVKSTVIPKQYKWLPAYQGTKELTEENKEAKEQITNRLKSVNLF